jgi:predicted transcriptional regulator
MARTSIYIPDELKSRMDKVSHIVNWSAIAQQAFEDLLATDIQKIKDASKAVDEAYEVIKNARKYGIKRQRKARPSSAALQRPVS